MLPLLGCRHFTVCNAKWLQWYIDDHQAFEAKRRFRWVPFQFLGPQSLSGQAEKGSWNGTSRNTYQTNNYECIILCIAMAVGPKKVTEWRVNDSYSWDHLDQAELIGGCGVPSVSQDISQMFDDFDVRMTSVRFSEIWMFILVGMKGSYLFHGPISKDGFPWCFSEIPGPCRNISAVMFVSNVSVGSKPCT